MAIYKNWKDSALWNLEQWRSKAKIDTWLDGCVSFLAL